MHVLRAALLHEEDEMRLNALEMLCLHPKMTEPPTPGFLSQHILIKHTVIVDSAIERLKEREVLWRVRPAAYYRVLPIIAADAGRDAFSKDNLAHN